LREFTWFIAIIQTPDKAVIFPQLKMLILGGFRLN